MAVPTQPRVIALHRAAQVRLHSVTGRLRQSCGGPMPAESASHPENRQPGRRLALALAALTVALPATVGIAAATTPSAPPAVAGDAALPFDPPTAAMKASPRKV